MDARTGAIFAFSTGNSPFQQYWSEKKNQNCQFKLKIGVYSNSNMKYSMVMLTFSVFNWNYPFWENLVQKIKIVNLS